MTEQEKKLITREKHPGRVAQGHKLAALMIKKKRRNTAYKEQSTVQSTEQSSVQSSVQPSGQSTVHSNDIYVYAVGMLPVLSICVCVFFAYNTFQSKKLLPNEKRSTIKTTPYAFKKYTINGYF